MPEVDEDWLEEMAERTPQHLDPNSGISIKRDVHNAEIGNVDVKTFVTAFQQAMIEPDAWFGLIQILRAPDMVGKPFKLHERFQGRYSIEAALGHDPDDDDDGFFEKLIEKALRWVEDKTLSDYGEVTELQLEPSAETNGIAWLKYIYLSGTPIAGSSTFIVAPTGPQSVRFTSVFEYQELAYSSVLLFGAGGLKMHGQVTIAEIDKACAISGGKLLSMDLPPEWRYKPDE